MTAQMEIGKANSHNRTKDGNLFRHFLRMETQIHLFSNQVYREVWSDHMISYKAEENNGHPELTLHLNISNFLH